MLKTELINWHANISESARIYFLSVELYNRNKTAENFERMCFWYERAVWGN